MLLCIASGLLFGNILLVRFHGFPVSLTTVFTAALLAMRVRRWILGRQPLGSLALPAIVLLYYELAVHGLGGGGWSGPQWPRSYALLLFAASLTIVASGVRISPAQLPLLARWASALAYAMGLLGLTQSVLGNALGIDWVPLPLSMAVGGASASTDSERFLGLFRARGVSTEFSYYGVGMAVLATLCLCLADALHREPRGRRFRLGGLVAATAGVAASASFAAWGLLGLVLVAWALLRPSVLWRRKAVVVLLVGLIGVTAHFTLPFLQARFAATVSSARDASMTYRLRTALDLIRQPGAGLRESLLGSGVGMDSANAQVPVVFERYFSRAFLKWLSRGREGIMLANGWAYAAVTLGWVGLALNAWLIAAALHRPRIGRIPRAPLLALAGGYLWSCGSYLAPEWWALLVLVNGLALPAGQTADAGVAAALQTRAGS